MTSPSAVLLSTSYLPPVQYITKFLLYDDAYIEFHENYQKQSFRNRCIISAANGPLTLVIPVKKKPGVKTRITDIKIDYDVNWQKLHWRSIVSAYKNSPYFDFFEDEMTLFYEKKELYLVDYNMKILNTLFKMLRLEVKIHKTEKYVSDKNFHDYRQSINPKKRLEKPDMFFQPSNYHQVFLEKFGFIPNLSIIDLIFNEGPNSCSVLNLSIKRGCVKSQF